MPLRHRFLEPIHNVKEERVRSLSAAVAAKLVVFIPGKCRERDPRAVSRSKAAPYGALRGAGRAWRGAISFR